MKRLAIALLLMSGEAHPDTFTVTESPNPLMCEAAGHPVSCAYLLALIRKIQDEQLQPERFI